MNKNKLIERGNIVAIYYIPLFLDIDKSEVKRYDIIT
jgi:hypothetical protein